MDLPFTVSTGAIQAAEGALPGCCLAENPQGSEASLGLPLFKIAFGLSLE